MTIEELSREVVSAIDAEDGYLSGQLWASRRYQEIVARIRLKPLLKFGSIVVPGVYNTGTITLTKNSPVVTGTNTNWTNALVGRFIKRNNAWYEIKTVDSATQLTLSLPYLETSAISVSYFIIPRRVPLFAGIRQIIEFRTANNPSPLQKLGIGELDIMEPERTDISGFINFTAEVGIDSSSPPLKVYEFYPYPRTDQIVNFTYYEGPKEFLLSDTLPDFIDPGVLKEGMLIDAYRFQMGRALKEGRVDVAGFWRNELRAQETKWEYRLREVEQAAAGSDDGTLILRRSRGASSSC